MEADEANETWRKEAGRNEITSRVHADVVSCPRIPKLACDYATNCVPRILFSFSKVFIY
jgi:hypothetical protein